MNTHLNGRARRAADAFRFLTASPRTLRYIGWVGSQNLGDEALWAATREYFAPLPLLTQPSTHRTWLKRFLDRKRLRAAILGGGTLIGDRYLRDCHDRQSRGESLYVFGTGVRTPSFWKYRERWVSLERWAGVLNAAAYVGVRGPRSVADLGEVGVTSELLGDPIARYVRPGLWAPKEKTLGLNIGTARGTLWGDEGAFLNGVAEFARHRIQAGWSIEWFVVWPEDLHIVHEVCRQAALSDQVIHEIYDDADQYLQLVYRMQCFVGMKLHALALALCAGVPSVSLAYQPKCLDFMDSLNLGEFAITTDNAASGKSVEELVRALEQNGPSISERAVERLSAFCGLQIERSSQIVTAIENGHHWTIKD